MEEGGIFDFTLSVFLWQIFPEKKNVSNYLNFELSLFTVNNS